MAALVAVAPGHAQWKAELGFAPASSAPRVKYDCSGMSSGPNNQKTTYYQQVI